ncbi:glycosyltransferase family 2 protein [Piscinibacter gummiphilus]|uniref:Glycosyltransferase family 2 protein n=1 Tax=Piscinibacter gummiphilus TaxID=946333 RepID=A0ABZ0CYP6_9BURK|nr:glycosyltransferase family 2 protein [Piscinibacter gummiphilus]WOB10075.1 glycosyltransferase family 2 protein [Piscinibacter gummiphilus]
MINIVIPMAGMGSRFASAGYAKPKPFIDVDRKPMIVRVLENLAHPGARYILIARKEHLEAEAELVRQIEQEFNAVFIALDQLTEGTACTVLYARKFINNDDALLIANSDQLVDMRIGDFIDDCARRQLDGSILTFLDERRDPKWSFARIDDQGLVVEVQEKRAISEYATVGIYLYQRGRDFVDAAVDMFIARDRVNQEYYTCPTYNYAIRAGLRIGLYNIDVQQMHGLGTPEDLNAYLRSVQA